MPHKMHLDKIWFDLIIEGIKKVELRLNDEKRQAIKVGDAVEFICNETGEVIKRTVVRLENYGNFDSYFSTNPSGGEGFEKEIYNFMRSELDRYYDNALVKKYGVLAIYLEKKHDILSLKKALSAACSKETCYPKAIDGWNENNRFRGHCAVAALILQDELGGRLCKGIVREANETHYYNEIDGEKIDLTSEQYGYFPTVEDTEYVSREDVLANADTMRRYKLLSAKMTELKHN